MTRAHNFSGGPAALPLPVLEQIQRDLLDWRGQGASVMEISHRSEAFEALRDEVETELREILSIPDNYAVLFLGSSARAQFSMIPLNLLGDHQTADYVVTGFWSQLAVNEMARYGKVNIVANDMTCIPPEFTWSVNPNAAYCYYTNNETLTGLAFQHIPKLTYAPLVCDMTSCLLSEPLPVERFGMIFAGTQKNLGLAGLSVVIVRRDLIQHPHALTPLAFNYQQQDQKNSLLVTPPTFAIYVTGLVLRWLKNLGGLKKMQQINQAKAAKLYTLLDTYPELYQATSPKHNRSLMNVCFTLPNQALETRFITEAEQHNLRGLRGHPQAGGIRASIYNAVSPESVDALALFMQRFAEQHAIHRETT